jgi:glycosyltransferase involved in cell wall biosynthesis
MALRRSFLGQFNTLLSYSHQGAEQYIRAGFPPERVVVAPNAVSPRPARPAPERALSYRDGRATLIFVGRLQPRKRVDLLLQACAGLPERLRPRLWIVGDGPARVELEAFAAQVYPEAQFFGAQHGADLEPLLAEADLFVLPGTGGLAVQQAMSFGLPVIVAEGDGTQSDLVRPGNGWQVTPGRLDALGAALAHALADPARLRQMGRESFRVVSEEINLERMVAGFAQAVEIALRSTSSKRP